jgi:hypothetical protein
MRIFIQDMYKGWTYVLNEHSYALAETADVPHRRFARAWEGLVGGFKVYSSSANSSSDILTIE